MGRRHKVHETAGDHQLLVFAPPGKKLTPSRRFEVVRMGGPLSRRKSSLQPARHPGYKPSFNRTPIFFKRSSSSAFFGFQIACILPPSSLMAAAEITPSGAAPMPITACTPTPLKQLNTQGIRSPSMISAPWLRWSAAVNRSSLRGRSSTVMVSSRLSRRLRALQAAERSLPAQGGYPRNQPRSFPTHSLSMYVSEAWINPPEGGSQHANRS